MDLSVLFLAFLLCLISAPVPDDHEFSDSEFGDIFLTEEESLEKTQVWMSENKVGGGGKERLFDYFWRKSK